jgi:hypothetical protein
MIHESELPSNRIMIRPREPKYLKPIVDDSQHENGDNAVQCSPFRRRGALVDAVSLRPAESPVSMERTECVPLTIVLKNGILTEPHWVVGLAEVLTDDSRGTFTITGVCPSRVKPRLS